MPFLAVLATINRNFLLALKNVIDTFNRANTTDSLGSAKGQGWKIWRGGWRINSNKAEITTAASGYPLATLTFLDEDVTIGVDGPSPGMGMSFWVSDAGNWWGAAYSQTYSCQTCFNCASSSCTAYTCNSANCNAYTCNIYSTVCGSSNLFYTAPNYTCTSNSFYTAPNYCCNITGGQNPRYNASNCFISSYTVNKVARYTCNTSNLFYTAPNYTCSECGGRNIKYNTPVCNITGGQNLKYNCDSPTYPCNSSNCNAYFCTAASCNAFVCNAFFAFDCNCVTTYKINILQAVANTVSQVTTSNFSAAIASFKSILSGNNITVKAFSGSGYNSQIGSDWAAVTNVNSTTKNKKHGILGSQSSHAQGNAIDEFRVENNV